MKSPFVALFQYAFVPSSRPKPGQIWRNSYYLKGEWPPEHQKGFYKVIDVKGGWVRFANLNIEDDDQRERTAVFMGYMVKQ